ncbi:hypothetical protein N431DRAFT_467251 [Stipitochalara longipes BDJ]|nr:hypothetical protein N431DRAFT_467251 [Stipitochalara longipes BDJ]
MAKVYKSWIYTRARDYRPGGILRLGQILTDPYNPASARISSTAQEIPAHIQVDKSKHLDATLEHSEALEVAFNAWANIYGMPVGLSGKVETKDEMDVKWHFDELRGETMAFDDQYCQEALRDNVNVVSYIERQWSVEKIFKRLYMITGVRTAVGAKMTKTEKHTQEAGGQAKFDGSGANVPLQVGAGLSGKQTSGSKESFEEATDFVYQYQLYQIRYYPHFKPEPFTHGQTEGEEPSSEEPKQQPKEIDSLEFKGFGEEFDGDVVNSVVSDAPVRIYTQNRSASQQSGYFKYFAPEEAPVETPEQAPEQTTTAQAESETKI